jgi:hypothetical protein
MAMMALGLPWVACPACTSSDDPPPPTILDQWIGRLQTFQDSILRPDTASPDDVIVCIRTLRFTPTRWVPICSRCKGKGRLSLLNLK